MSDEHFFALRNANGVEVRAISLGAIIQSIRVPDRHGHFGDIVLGYDDVAGYVTDQAYLGAAIGRYANRISRGRFVLDGREHRLAVNDGPNHLHGGPGGFHKVTWTGEAIGDAQGSGVRFTRVSPDGEEGYPGRLEVRITYTLTQQDELVVDYEAATDRPTPINLTQHSYFNLSGDAERDVLDHELTLHASEFTPVDPTLIPTGELRSVAGTPFDFRQPKRIGTDIDTPDVQLAHAGGYDHNFVLAPGGGKLTFAARVWEPTTGRTLEIHTTEPGIQFYSGNFLDGSIRGKVGARYRKRSGFCLETQHFPDSPNHPAFPSTILRPGERWESRTVFRFGVA